MQVNLPAAVNVFWITSSTYTTVQACVPLNPSSSKPKTPNQFFQPRNSPLLPRPALTRAALQRLLIRLPFAQQRITAPPPPPPAAAPLPPAVPASNVSESVRNAAKADLQAQLAHIDAVVAAARARLPAGASAMAMKEEVQRGIDEVR